MDLPSGHMHVNLIFDPIQNGGWTAIFDVKMDPKCSYQAIAQTSLDLVEIWHDYGPTKWTYARYLDDSQLNRAI